MNSNIVKGALFCLLTGLAWGGMFPVAGIILREMDPFWLGLIRYGSAAIVFALLLLLAERRQAFRLEGRGLQLFLLGSSGFAGFSFLAFLGQRMAGVTGALVASIIMAMMPLLTAIVMWAWKGSRPAPFTIGAIVVAFVGVVTVVTHGNLAAFSAAGNSVLGDVLILFGALSWVIYTVGAGAFPTWSPLRYTTLTCVLGTITIAVITLGATAVGALHAPTGAVLGDVALPMLYMIFFAAVMAVYTWNTGIRALGPLNGILFINLVPVTTFTITALSGHPVTAIEIMGASLTIAALIANNLYQRRVAAKAAVKTAAAVDPGLTAAPAR